MPGSSVLYASPRLNVRLRSVEGGRRRPLVVTFDSLNADLRLDRKGFGEDWLHDSGHDAVHVISAANAWYQHADMAPACAAVRAAAALHPWTATYGSSMGGYAAIRFADAVGARTAVALSPQFSIDPLKTPFETRWVEYAEDLAFIWDGARPANPTLQTAFVVYDPTDGDRRHAELLAEHYPVTPFPLPYAGHPAGTFLAETQLLGRSVLAMIDGTFDPGALRGELRAARRRSGKYHFVLSERQPAWRPDLSHRLAAEAARLNPASGAYLSAYARTLEARGDLDEAERLRLRAVEIMPGEPAFRLPLAALRLRRGASADEITALATGLGDLGVRRTVYFTRAVKLLFLSGAFEAARAEARDAVRRRPNSLTLRAWAAWLSVSLAIPGLGPGGMHAIRRLILLHRKIRWSRQAADR